MSPGHTIMHERTEVMVLRFTEDGELDHEFGPEGLAVPSCRQIATKGTGSRCMKTVRSWWPDQSASQGELDAALFHVRRDTAGRPGSFGDNGMLVTEVSQDDDMALAVDVQGDVVSLSGFASVDGIREFLFISHQVEIFRTKAYPLALQTGSNTTGLRIDERQVTDSYQEYSRPAGPRRAWIPVQTMINTTPFGYFSNDISYAVAPAA